jgi:hypothetical protein
MADTSQTRLERLTQLGINALREMKQPRKPSPKLVIMQSTKEVLEQTVDADGNEEEDVEEDVVEIEGDEQDTSEGDETDEVGDEEAEEVVEVAEDEDEENEDEEDDAEDEENEDEEEQDLASEERAHEVLQGLADEAEEVETEEAGEEAAEGEAGEEPEANQEDAILEALVAALDSNEDMHVDKTRSRAVARRIRDDLANYDDELVRAAIFVTHLSVGTFPGMHSYTFRHEVVVDGAYDVARLFERDYVWPEVYNNNLLADDMKLAYAKLDDSEIGRVRGLLEHDEPLPPHSSMVCYTNNGACDGMRKCSVTAKREIIVPGMDDGKPVGYCFQRDVLFDVLLTQTTPANPRTGEAFPPQLVANMYRKYKGELLMRAYYLETSVASQAA